jgi:hypothetical protein
LDFWNCFRNRGLASAEYLKTRADLRVQPSPADNVLRASKPVGERAALLSQAARKNGTGSGQLVITRILSGLKYRNAKRERDGWHRITRNDLKRPKPMATTDLQLPKEEGQGRGLCPLVRIF